MSYEKDLNIVWKGKDKEGGGGAGGEGRQDQTHNKVRDRVPLGYKLIGT